MKRKLGRKKKHRTQTLKNLASAIILYEKINTTEPRAKEVRSIIEHMINLGKEKTLDSQRRLLSYFGHNKNTVDKIVKEIGPRFSDKKSGYLKMFKTQPRHGDNSKMVTIILAKSKFLGNIENAKKLNKPEEQTKNKKIAPLQGKDRK